jgi:hypothetical protein
MVRRVVCLGVILVLAGLPACGNDTKPATNTGRVVPDPEGALKPKDPVGKGG